jgi:serine/threonine-protein kinase PpkA
MHRILVVDDEEAIRKNLDTLLSLEGFEVATAPNGQHGFVVARSMLPDIIITDINMPVMDGYALLEAVRAHPELERTVVIMLTAAEDRDHMRKGMARGADDYITKPFKRDELLDAIAAQLEKIRRFDRHKNQAVSLAVAQTAEQAKVQFRQRYDTADSLAPSSHFSTLSSPTDSPARTMQATVLFADIRNFTTIAERLTADELSTLLSRYFEEICRPVVAFGGTHLKMLGDGLLALFEGDSHDRQAADDGAHASRALSAAIALHATAQAFGAWVAQAFSGRGLSEFSVGIGLHSGEVTLGQVGSQRAREVTPLGATVDMAAQLQAAGKDLGWAIAASAKTTLLVGGGLRQGRVQAIQIHRQEETLSACEVLAYEAAVDLQLGLDSAALAFESAAVELAAQENSQTTARAAKDALNQSLRSLQSGAISVEHQHFKGYQLVRKLDAGGTSDVFLAYSAAKNTEVVLKVLRTAMHNDADMLRRFIQEYAVLATVEHHHIAKIYDQGFTEEFAYIAMEYLSGGSLKTEIAKRPNHARVIDLLRQIVSALDTIHHQRLVYRDLKPDNLMFRASGELVLVDFGMVKNIRDDTDALVRTQQGQIVGTPYYVSPEQVLGKEITNRSDFYSLGVILYELLTGVRPYRGDTLGELLACHVQGAMPQLAAEHAKFQPLLTRLMAKSPDDRPADCTALWRHFELLRA